MDRASRFITFKAVGSNIEDVQCLIGDGGVRIVAGFGGWDSLPRPRKTAMTVWRGFEPLTLDIPVIIRTNQSSWSDGKRIEADCIALGMMAGRGEPAPEPQKRQGKVVRYRAKKGDTWGSVASKFNVDLADLLQLNSIRDPAKLKLRQSILIPQQKSDEPFGEPPKVRLVADGSLVPYNDLAWDDDGIDFKRWVIESIDWGTARRNIYGDRVRQDATVTVLQYVAPAYATTRMAPWRRNTKHKRKK